MSLPDTLPVVATFSILISVVQFSKFNAIASILGPVPVFGTYIPVIHLWKLTEVALKDEPFSIQNPVPAAAPTAFVKRQPLTMKAQPGWSAFANIKPVVVVTPPFVEVTFLSCILPIPLPSLVT